MIERNRSYYSGSPMRRPWLWNTIPLKLHTLFYANGVMSRSPGLPSPDGYPGTIAQMILNRNAVPSRPWI